MSNSTSTNGNEAKPSKIPPKAATQPTTSPPAKLILPRRMTLLFMLSIFIMGVLVILWVWNLGPFNTPLQQTDNSYLKGPSTILSSQVNGYVDTVFVRDFDNVKQGQPLIKISSANYNQQVVQAQSSLEQAQTNLTNQNQTIAQRQAEIKAAQAKVGQVHTQLTLSIQQLNRLESLVSQGAVSQNEVDTAKANVDNNQALLKQAQANVDVAFEALKTAQVAQTGLDAQVKSAKAQVLQANLNKNYGMITAPISGKLGQINIRTGQYVAQGAQLVYIVPSTIWVIANFKETQMNHIRGGQKAWFTVDALNKQKFTGVVTSISPATGSEFSVIKTDNATGNFTKVVQRISVRIDIDPNQSRAEQLAPGMSVVTTVDTKSR